MNRKYSIGITGTSRTVAFFLPGQSCTSSLIHLFQSTFPCERHVFAYDGCASSVMRSTATFSTSTASSVSITPMLIPQSKVFYSKLAKLSSSYANATEAWMSSVSSFLSMKDEEQKNEYLPFVCRLGFIMGRTDGIGDTKTDVSKLALTNVLQYISGSRSRPLKEAVIETAFKALKDFREKESKMKHTPLTHAQKVVLEDCVFCHKSILIGDKTLMDTVQPTVEWSLKAATKLTGCACCAPEEEYDEDEDITTENILSEETKLDSPFLEPSFKRQSKFMDGKASFAFDPNLFTGGKALMMS